jgi:uncharacterized membrane protein (UPF0127 family)
MNAGALAIIAAMTSAAAIASSCKQDVKGPINQNLPTTTMRLGAESFTLEIADEDKEREIGLMNRRAMPASHGMIFVFPEEERRSFYMKNTLIPLDIVYADADGDIVSIHQMQPLDLTGISSRAPAKYAIELNLGTAARLGLKPGDHLDIPKDAANTDR